MNSLLRTYYCRNCGVPGTPAEAICHCGAYSREGRNFCDACGNSTYSGESQCTNCSHVLATGNPAFSHTIVASVQSKILQWLRRSQ